MGSKQWMVGGLSAWLMGVVLACGEEEWPSKAFHRVLDGTVGEGLEVRMVLERRDDRVEGFYYYKKHRKILHLSGEASLADNSVKVDEYLGEAGSTPPGGTWQGRFDDAGVFSGTWTGLPGDKMLPFRLSVVNSTDVLEVRPVHRALHCEYVRDDHRGGLNWDLKYVRFSPQRDGVGTINQWIRSQVQASMMDSVEDGPEKEKAIAGATDESIEKRLRGMAGEGALEMTGFAPESHVLKVQVVHNADGILCLGLDHWAYEGGAHGNGYTEYVVFDVATGRRLRLAQVLKPGFEKSLAKIGRRLLLEEVGANPEAPLSEAGLFSDSLELNRNWFVTVEGIGFSYSPYEIASFARGFVVFTIPFAELKPWLKDDTLVSRMVSAR